MKGSKLRCTPEHKIYSFRGWVEARELPHTRQHYEGIVYDLEVEDTHDFYAEDELVHNCLCWFKPVLKSPDDIYAALKEKYKPTT